MTITINNAVKGKECPPFAVTVERARISPPGYFANNPGWCMLAPVRT